MKSLIFVLTIIASFVAVASESPYAGQEAREIKSLSQQEIDSYLNGKGMGYARAAELNDYPGPLHVLELAKSLALTDEQLAKTQALYDRMKAQVAELGKTLVGKERELDRQFAEGSIKADTLRELVAEIGALEAKIRYVHLEAHLEQRAILSGQQVRLYNRLRGYGAGHPHGHDHDH